jgi:hypothetical protein
MSKFALKTIKRPKLSDIRVLEIQTTPRRGFTFLYVDQLIEKGVYDTSSHLVYNGKIIMVSSLVMGNGGMTVFRQLGTLPHPDTEKAFIMQSMFEGFEGSKRISVLTSDTFDDLLKGCDALAEKRGIDNSIRKFFEKYRAIVEQHALVQ